MEVLGQRYRVERELGRGGMGRVFVAHDLKLDRDVALKVLHPGDHDARDVLRFEQEARAAGALDHPNVVAVHDIGTHEGAPYIISELLCGRTLRAELGAGPIPLAKATEYARQLARGLAAAHGKGVIHRDLKPENLFVTDQGVLKILDFGIAKLTQKPAEAATDTGAIVGTVGYMAPEQVRGERVDPRADFFAFGAIFYEMLCGRRAFDRPSPLETAYTVVNEEPPALPASVPRRVRKVVSRCLSKNPAVRYASADELERALSPLPPRSRLRTAIDVVLLLVAIGITAVLALSPDARDWVGRLRPRAPAPVKQLAILPFRSVGGGPDGEAFAAGMSETLNNKLRQLERFQGSLQVVSGYEMAREGVVTARDARRVFGATLALTATLRWPADRITATSELVDTATQTVLSARDADLARSDAAKLTMIVLERASEMLDLQLRPDARRALADSSVPEPGAYEFYLQGRGYLQRHDRLDSLESALALFEKALGRDRRYAPAWAGEAEALLRKFELTKDSRLVEEARIAAKRAVELAPTLAPAHVTMGLLHGVAGEHAEAIASLLRARELDPGDADAIRELARAYDDAGRLQDAEATFRQAIEIRPYYWAAYKDLGLFYNRHGRIEEAIPLLKHVTDLTPDNYTGYANLAAMHMRLGRHAEAAALLEKSLSLSHTAQAYSNLGVVYYLQKRYADAAGMFFKSVELDPTDDRTWGNYADATRYVPGKAEESARAYREAAAQAKKQLQVNPRHSELRSRLAMYEAFGGDKRTALREIAEALRGGQGDGLVQFRSALVYEVNGMREKALKSIRDALALGFSREQIENAPPLEQLRRDPRYR